MTESTTCQPRPRPWPVAAVLVNDSPPHWPGITWIVRPSGGHGTRPALEMYVAGALVDVLVATPLSPAVLGGGRAMQGPDERAIAWGRQTSDGPPEVEFRRMALIGRPRPAAVTAVGEWFWVAKAHGRFTSVTTSYGGGERLRLRRIRP